MGDVAVCEIGVLSVLSLIADTQYARAHVATRRAPAMATHAIACKTHKQLQAHRRRRPLPRRTTPNLARAAAVNVAAAVQCQRDGRWAMDPVRRASAMAAQLDRASTSDQ